MKITEISLNPNYSNNKTYKYNIEGWGIIYIQLSLKEIDIECRIAVNSEKRAQKWENNYPKLGSSELWNWKAKQENKLKN